MTVQQAVEEAEKDNAEMRGWSDEGCVNFLRGYAAAVFRRVQGRAMTGEEESEARHLIVAFIFFS